MDIDITKKEIFEEIFQTYKVGISIINMNNYIEFENSNTLASNPFISLNSSLLDEMSQSLAILNSNQWYTFETKLFENYSIMRLNLEDVTDKIILTGPILTKKYEEEFIKFNLIQNGHVNSHEVYLNHYRTVPVLTYKERQFIYKLIYFTLTGKTYHEPILSMELNSSFTNSINAFETNDFSSHLKSSDKFDMQAENMIMVSIKEGSPTKLDEYFELLANNDSSVLANESVLRSAKNKAIASITMAGRASIDGGLEHNMAFTLSNHFIQKVENTTSLQDIKKLIISVFKTYAELVSKAQVNGLSKYVIKTIHYIEQNIHDHILISDISHAIGLSESYLSKLFKIETGISIKKFITNKKLELAKKYLTFSNLEISEISTRLGFVDQSHLTKLFKSHNKTTPLAYRLNRPIDK